MYNKFLFQSLRVGAVICLYILLSLLVYLNLAYYPFFAGNIFLLEVLESPFKIPLGLIYFCSIVNILLIYFISKKIFSEKVAFLTILVYSTSIWTIYLAIFNSLYMFGVFFLLLLFLGMVYQEKSWSLAVASLGLIGMLICSITFWIPALFLIALFFYHKIINQKTFKIEFIIFLVCIGLLMLVGIRNLENLKQIISHNFNIFEDVGLINAVNNFQGEIKSAGYGLLGRIIDNKYFYLNLKFIYNLSVHFTPATFFTPFVKVLGFSAQPPIFWGFLIPFIMGIGYLRQQKKGRIALSIFLLLIFPSVLASNSPDLNRLFLVAPLLFLAIGIGLNKLMEKKWLLTIVILVVLIQVGVVWTDIYLREPMRLDSLANQINGKND